ncbi:hypothetical protein JTE90_009171 [Oedothorax gibbosus]|uniref:Uncharacterized protein n=1 Tax=Oedothorax gibbosus TaxID=931172 RepID=A0AAV6UWC4_9ARAC|nr:hypothetical protein JTE90_009171 [Oedothorax gibbosus]
MSHKKGNKQNFFDAPVKESAVCKNKSFATESLNDIDLAFEVESEDHVFRSKPQEVSKQSYSISSFESLEYQSQEEKAQLSENQEPYHRGRNLSASGANLPITENDIQGISSLR